MIIKHFFHLVIILSQQENIQ